MTKTLISLAALSTLLFSNFAHANILHCSTYTYGSNSNSFEITGDISAPNEVKSLSIQEQDQESHPVLQLSIDDVKADTAVIFGDDYADYSQYTISIGDNKVVGVLLPPVLQNPSIRSMPRGIVAFTTDHVEKLEKTTPLSRLNCKLTLN